MTSINAIRLDRQRGILLCDEASYWNEEWMILYTPDKIQSIIGRDILERTRTTLYLGMSGSSMMGEPIINLLHERVEQRFGDISTRQLNRNRKPLIETLAHEAFSVACEVKARYIDDFLHNRYGFTSHELIAGSYQRDGRKIAIDDEEIQKEARAFMTYSEQSPEVASIFKNTLFLAGYSPTEGFRLFFMTTLDPVLEEVAEIYVNGGSGTDTTDLVYSAFAASQTVAQRRQGIDPVDATITAFSGLLTACRLSGGVAPYPNFIMIDGTSDCIDRRIFDHRSQLVLEAVTAHHRGLLSKAALRKLVQGMLFDSRSFRWGNDFLQANVTDSQLLARFLRGYYVAPGWLPHIAPVARIIR